MGRRREEAGGAAAAAAPSAAKPQPRDESAFERLSHRRHFDVLGRKCVLLTLRATQQAVQLATRATHHARCGAGARHANPMHLHALSPKNRAAQAERHEHQPVARAHGGDGAPQAHAAARIPAGACACRVRRRRRLLRASCAHSTAKRAASSTGASARRTRQPTPTRRRCGACSACGRCSLVAPAALRLQARSAAVRAARLRLP